jgi:hypothetical protein
MTLTSAQGFGRRGLLGVALAGLVERPLRRRPRDLLREKSVRLAGKTRVGP